jgi:hypothetical protein
MIKQRQGLEYQGRGSPVRGLARDVRPAQQQRTGAGRYVMDPASPSP